MGCKTGKENLAVDQCKKLISDSPASEYDFAVWFPSKEVTEKHGTTYTKVTRPLFPGYVFIRWDGLDESQFPFSGLQKLPPVVKVLNYSDRSHALIGNDLKYAMWIDSNSGFITQSKVFFTPGQKIHIVQGPLVGFDGNVVKVDRHHKRITLRFDFDGNSTEISFTVDFLEQNITAKNLSSN